MLVHIADSHSQKVEAKFNTVHVRTSFSCMRFVCMCSPTFQTGHTSSQVVEELVFCAQQG